MCVMCYVNIYLPSILPSTNRFGGGFERMKEKINRIKRSVVIHEERMHGWAVIGLHFENYIKDNYLFIVTLKNLPTEHFRVNETDEITETWSSFLPLPMFINNVM